MRGMALAIACALLLAGCGGSSPQLAPIERGELHAFVDRARAAARAGDLAGTDAALEALQTRVRGLRAAGRIDEAVADQLLKFSAVAQLRARTTLAPGRTAAKAGAEVDE
jgi:hypothetical protein